jgi:hypothetical protein
VYKTELCVPLSTAVELDPRFKEAMPTKAVGGREEG